MKDNVTQLNVKRVQKYMQGLPEDDKGNLVVNQKDLDTMKELFFGHHDKSRKTLRQMVEEQGEQHGLD